MMTLRPLLVPALLAACFALPSRAESDGADSPAHAGDSDRPSAPAAPQLSSRLQAAKRLYQKLDLDAAMAELKEAEQDAKAKDNEEELVLILIYKGLIFADQGKPSDMSDHFKRALAMRPWTEMPPETSPRIAKQFANSRRELWGSPLKPPPRKKKMASAPATPQPSVTFEAPPGPMVVPAPEGESPRIVVPAPAPTPATPDGLVDPK